MPTVISVEQLGKAYRLGQIGTGTLSYDLKLWWARMRGKPNPLLRIGETDHGNRDGETLWALKDVSFTVEQGEVLGIIGRNGAGKSTLLKILSRVTAPTSGRIKVKGRIASLLEVGTGFHPDLTGRENIYLNGAILGMKREEIALKFDEIVDFAEVEKFIDTPVKRYSSGMYVRLAFAVAAHLEPEILVVDEVLAVGDAAFQKKCLGKIGEVAKVGRTVLFVSHNMSAITSLCTTAIILDCGRLSYGGDVKYAVVSCLSANNDNYSVDGTLYHPIRKGTGKALFTYLKAASLTSDNQPASEILFGSTIVIETEVHAFSDIVEANVGIEFYDKSNYRIIDVNIALEGHFLSMMAGEKRKIKFYLYDVLLKPDVYTINLWIGRGSLEDIDYVTNAGRIEVVADVSSFRHTEIFPGTYQCRFSSAID
jgi:lipopolysaccharide transport system ATP-binding protein